MAVLHVLQACGPAQQCLSLAKVEINTQDLSGSTVAFAPADSIGVDTWAGFRPRKDCPLHPFDGHREMVVRLTTAAGPSRLPSGSRGSVGSCSQVHLGVSCHL